MTGDVSPLGLLSFLTFAFSVIAAVLAIDMYKLLRTGDFGKTWRLLIIASVIFVLLQVVRLAAVLDLRARQAGELAQVVELCFVMALAFAFYQQGRVFTREKNNGLAEHDGTEHDESEYSLAARGYDEAEDAAKDAADEVEWTTPHSDARSPVH